MKNQTVEDNIIIQLRRKFIERGKAEWFNTGELENKLSVILCKTPGTINRTLRRMIEDKNKYIECEKRPTLYSKVLVNWYRYVPSKYDFINIKMSKNDGE